MFELTTYEDLQAWFCAEGWGCKCCGKLYSPEWYQCSGDTYCKGCQQHMSAELELTWTQYPHTADFKATQSFPYAGDNAFGFEYAAHARREHERIYG